MYLVGPSLRSASKAPCSKWLILFISNGLSSCCGSFLTSQVRSCWFMCFLHKLLYCMVFCEKSLKKSIIQLHDKKILYYLIVKHISGLLIDMCFLIISIATTILYTGVYTLFFKNGDGRIVQEFFCLFFVTTKLPLCQTWLPVEPHLKSRQLRVVLLPKPSMETVTQISLLDPAPIQRIQERTSGGNCSCRPCTGSHLLASPAGLLILNGSILLRSSLGIQ